ncbi:glycosyltransferase family 2 protein [Sorangium sp. So ce131]|uniref:glycosyltransferase family 2 protein n=1 Tax=Sorangium sp. So ce131 TaxID=3133282 RepID=UPI003F64042C
MTDPWLTIVIPIRNEASNLWFTLNGLDFQGLDGVEIIVADNGGIGSKDIEAVTKGFGAPARYLLADETASVNHPRNAGVAAARGRWILILDAHVLLSPGTIALLRRRAEEEGAYPPLSLVHIPLRNTGRTHVLGHYKLTLEDDFWGKWGPVVRETDRPYRISASGNYALFTRRHDFAAVRGFNPRFVGYAGDEVYFQLKYWRLGGSVWLEPLVCAAHYSGPRAYRVRQDEVDRNLGLAGRVVVGPEFLPRFGPKLAAHAVAKGRDPELLARALAEGVAAAEQSGEPAWLEGAAVYSFDDVIALWRREDVPVA